MVALPAHLAIEGDAEPGKVRNDRLFENSRRAGRIGIFDPQAQQASGGLRRALVAKRGIGVAEMKAAIGRGSEAECRAQSKVRRSGLRPRLFPKSARPASRSRKAVLAPAALIDGEVALAEAAAALALLDPETIPRLIEIGGPPPLRLREPGFAGMAAIIVSQQVSVASANAIYGRLQTLLAPLEAAALLAAQEEAVAQVRPFDAQAEGAQGARA